MPLIQKICTRIDQLSLIVLDLTNYMPGILDLEKIAMISVSLDSANCLIWFLVSPCLPLRVIRILRSHVLRLMEFVSVLVLTKLG